MRILKRTLILLGACSFVFLPLKLKADTVTENFSWSTPTGSVTISAASGGTNGSYDFGSSTSIPQFNTSLGTLTGVSIFENLSEANVVEGSPSGTADLYAVFTDPAGTDTSGTGTFGYGEAPFSIFLTTTDTPLSDFENGNYTISLTIYNSGTDSASLSTFINFNGTVTYTYTPAVAPVPEPPSLALFGSGALGLLLLGAVRRRRSA